MQRVVLKGPDDPASARGWPKVSHGQTASAKSQRYIFHNSELEAWSLFRCGANVQIQHVVLIINCWSLTTHQLPSFIRRRQLPPYWQGFGGSDQFT